MATSELATPVPDDPAVRERALIVAHMRFASRELLRERGGGIAKRAMGLAWVEMARAIERGDHLKEPTP